jgi:hypothetical protein
MTTSVTLGVCNPLTQHLPLAGERSRRRLPFMLVSPLGERLGEGASR